MVLNTLTVGAAVTPTVIKTCGSHYLEDRKQRRQKPTAHISYDEGLHLIRSFLHYASYHTVEEIQAFTSQWVPSPRWVRTEDVKIPADALSKAADAIIAQLGHKGVDRVGGKTWWQWRRDEKPLRAEWIEMRAEHHRRKNAQEACKRVMLYVHGGAYFFGSVDEHRYQMQRHARKLRARVFAPRYRLAPQYPFPCGLFDCLAAYLYLLTVQDATTIVLAGDSAGAGMILSLMVILRDQGLDLPAGAILISPWVDLTHSFPSVAGTNNFDYIPAHGFLQRPSISWPPPNSDDMKAISLQAVSKLAASELPRKSTQQERDKATQEAIRGFSEEPLGTHLDPAGNKHNPTKNNAGETTAGDTIPGPGHNLSIELDGKMVEIKDQIQMYTTNQLIAHPLVSPVLQPTLGGLPPLLIQTGGGEMLRDEQIYLAHKAANPAKYPAPATVGNDYPEDIVHKYKPTDVQLQVWDDLCHVAPTLSFTRPAKYMYRSIAQFGAWALARAQRTEIEITDDDNVSAISSDDDTESDEGSEQPAKQPSINAEGEVGKAGDPLPPFRAHMVRQRVDRHGVIYPLETSQPSLQVAADEIGVIKAGPVRKWLTSKKTWDNKFAKEKLRVQRQRTKEMAKGYTSFGSDEVPPPSALAGRISANMPKEQATKRSWGMSLWSLWGSSHDEKAVEREGQAKSPSTTVATPKAGAKYKSSARSRSRSHVRDLGQTNDQAAAENSSNVARHQNGATSPILSSPDRSTLSPSFIPLYSAASPTENGQRSLPSITTEAPPGDPTAETSLLVLPGTNVTLDGPDAKRPKADARIAFPFKLGRSHDPGDNASTITLGSHIVNTPVEERDEKSLFGALATNGEGKGEESKGEQSNGQAERPPAPERFETAHELL